jgi:hypothetical protein
MSSFRFEVRLFALLCFALLVCYLLSVGIDQAGVTGDIYGLKINIVGPTAAFIVILLVFYRMDFFKFDIDNEDDRVLNSPMENLSLEEIETLLDQLLVKSRKIERCRHRLEAAKAALESDASQDAVMLASGMTPVRRPGT